MKIIIIIISALIAIPFIISFLLIYDMRKAENEYQILKKMWDERQR